MRIASREFAKATNPMQSSQCFPKLFENLNFKLDKIEELELLSGETVTLSTVNITGQYGGKLRSEISPWCGVVQNWDWNWELELVVKLVVRWCLALHFSRMIPKFDKGTTSYVPIQYQIPIQGYPLRWSRVYSMEQTYMLDEQGLNPLPYSNSQWVSKSRY